MVYTVKYLSTLVCVLCLPLLHPSDFYKVFNIITCLCAFYDSKSLLVLEDKPLRIILRGLLFSISEIIISAQWETRTLKCPEALRSRFLFAKIEKLIAGAPTMQNSCIVMPVCYSIVKVLA